MAGAGLVLALTVALASAASGDYSLRGPVAGDNAGPAIIALAHGNLHAFLTHQPLMGLLSLLLRAPVALVASLLGGGSSLAYRLGAFLCVAPLVMLFVSLLWHQRSSRRWLVGSAGLALVVLVPARAAVLIGHPEEVLAAALAGAATLAAISGRGLLAGLLLGLAIGTKQWALLAAVPVLLALRAQRVKAVGLAAAAALPLVALAPALDPAAFHRAAGAVGGGHLAGAFSAWWPVSSPLHGDRLLGAVSTRLLPFGLTRSQALSGSLILTMLAGALWGRSLLRRLQPEDCLLLLAFLCLLRCALDPVPLDYNLVSVLVPLMLWDVSRFERPPIAAALSTAAVAVVLGGTLRTSAPLINALAIATYLGIGIFLLRELARSAGLRTRVVAPRVTRVVPA